MFYASNELGKLRTNSLYFPRDCSSGPMLDKMSAIALTPFAEGGDDLREKKTFAGYFDAVSSQSTITRSISG